MPDQNAASAPTLRQLDAYDYELPAALIAGTPTERRDASRLLVVAEAGLDHRHFGDIEALLEPGDLLVVNDTRVVKARLEAEKDSGGRAELLLERIEEPRQALFQVRVSKALKAGRQLKLADGSRLVVLGREGEFYRLSFPSDVLKTLEALGSVPLPPYLGREAVASDEARYQTVYSRAPGAAAAPTAGLHFTEELLDALATKGVERVALTLHVGAGTFQPVRTNDVGEHVMHSERFCVSDEVVAAIERTRARGGRVVAVGTTVVRALESAARADGSFATGWQDTQLFITPGFAFRVVDVLVTNFHLPKSTLLMLVSAFAGYERVMSAYAAAVEAGYRFFSYGDAMLLERQP